MSLLGGGTTAAVGRSGPCSSIDAAIRGNGGRSMAPKAKACMRNAAVATAKTNSAMDTLLSSRWLRRLSRASTSEELRPPGGSR